MDAEISNNDGLVIKNLKFLGTPIAKEISIPFFYIRHAGLSSTAPGIRCELTKQKVTTAVNCKSELAPGGGIRIFQAAHSFDIYADFSVTDIQGTPGSDLEIHYFYYFYEQTKKCIVGGFRAPGHKADCAPFAPNVDYSYFQKGADPTKPITGQTELTGLEFPYRMDFNVFREDGTENFATLVKDKDDPVFPEIILHGGIKASVGEKENDTIVTPVPAEWFGPVLENTPSGGRVTHFDNVHIAYDRLPNDYDPLPTGFFQNAAYHRITVPGCIVDPALANDPPLLPLFLPSFISLKKSCMHIHWRWGKGISMAEEGGGPEFGHGSPFFPMSQDLHIAIVRNKIGEIDPGTGQSSAVQAVSSLVDGQCTVFHPQTSSFLNLFGECLGNFGAGGSGPPFEDIVIWLVVRETPSPSVELSPTVKWQNGSFFPKDTAWNFWFF